MAASWIGALAAAGCLGDDDGLGGAAPRALVAIETSAGEPVWELAYDPACRLIAVDVHDAPPASLEPRGYRNPLGLGAGAWTVRFGYDDEGHLATVRLVDSLRGGRRERRYEVLREGGRTAGLAPTSATFEGLPIDPGPQAVRFAYDSAGRIDSVVYADGYTIDFDFDERGDLALADYQRTPSGRPTREFYDYAAAPLNPFSALPLRYVTTYATFWAPRLATTASFDLRTHAYEHEGGRPVRHAELTRGDTAAVSYLAYEPLPCL